VRLQDCGAPAPLVDFTRIESGVEIALFYESEHLATIGPDPNNFSYSICATMSHLLKNPRLHMEMEISNTWTMPGVKLIDVLQNDNLQCIPSFKNLVLRCLNELCNWAPFAGLLSSILIVIKSSQGDGNKFFEVGLNWLWTVLTNDRIKYITWRVNY